MERANISPAVEIAVDALLLRKQQSELPALEVLDQSMRGRYGRPVDFGGLARPPAPFAFLVAEALDFMPRDDWEGLWGHNGRGEIRPYLLQIFADEVWPKFRVRYGLF